MELKRRQGKEYRIYGSKIALTSLVNEWQYSNNTIRQFFNVIICILKTHKLR